jgi:hypothetical protein
MFSLAQVFLPRRLRSGVTLGLLVFLLGCGKNGDPALAPGHYFDALSRQDSVGVKSSICAKMVTKFQSQESGWASMLEFAKQKSYQVKVLESKQTSDSEASVTYNLETIDKATNTKQTEKFTARVVYESDGWKLCGNITETKLP